MLHLMHDKFHAECDGCHEPYDTQGENVPAAIHSLRVAGWMCVRDAETHLSHHYCEKCAKKRYTPEPED